MVPRDTNTGYTGSNDSGDASNALALKESDAPAKNDQDNEASNSIVLTTAFNTAVGIGLGVGIKLSAITLFGMSAPVIVGAGLTIGLVNIGWTRSCDRKRHNKDNQEDLAGFFDIEKTGHNKKDYFLRGAFAAGASMLGGFLGFETAEAHIEFSQAIEDLQASVDELSETIDAIEQQTEQMLADAEAMHDNVAALHEDLKGLHEDIVAIHTLDLNEITERMMTEGVSVPAEEIISLFQDSKDDFPVDIQAVIDRMGSGDSAISAQALKDMGYFLANGFEGLVENDVVANKLFEASLEVSNGTNIQAAHDLGFQMLHGNGIDVDYASAHEFLSYANENGHPLSGEMLQYMGTHNLVPQP